MKRYCIPKIQDPIYSKYYYKSLGCTILEISYAMLTKLLGEDFKNYLYFKKFMTFIPKCKLLNKLIKDTYIKENIEDIQNNSFPNG